MLERRENTHVNEPISLEKFMYHIEASMNVNQDNAESSVEMSRVLGGRHTSLPMLINL